MLVRSLKEPSTPNQVLAILDEEGELVPISVGPNQQALAEFRAYDERVKNPVTIVVPSRKSSSEFAYLPLERRQKRKSRKARKNVA